MACQFLVANTGAVCRQRKSQRRTNVRHPRTAGRNISATAPILQRDASMVRRRGLGRQAALMEPASVPTAVLEGQGGRCVSNDGRQRVSSEATLELNCVAAIFLETGRGARIASRNHPRLASCSFFWLVMRRAGKVSGKSRRRLGLRPFRLPPYVFRAPRSSGCYAGPTKGEARGSQGVAIVRRSQGRKSRAFRKSPDKNTLGFAVDLGESLAGRAALGLYARLT